MQAKVNKLSRRERRQLGVTRFNIRRIVGQLITKDELDREDLHGTANQIGYVLLDENPQAFITVIDSDVEADWQAFFDAIVALIEKLLPLILKIIALFSQVMPMDASGLCQVDIPVACPFHSMAA